MSRLALAMSSLLISESVLCRRSSVSVSSSGLGSEPIPDNASLYFGFKKAKSVNEQMSSRTLLHFMECSVGVAGLSVPASFRSPASSARSFRIVVGGAW